tara:strand:- start:1813 stop:2781 length:969 start_codon:yes stop_codon:yes gene_type:complete
MKYYETTFDDYLKSLEQLNFHKKISFNLSDLSEKTCINELHNYIVYGPKASGKYSQVLYFLKNYSSKNLKYERKIVHTGSKGDFTFKASDIHYEIDMSLLGCNAKQLWNELYDLIKEIIRIAPIKAGFIVCKNFHDTPSELITLFYSYIQKVHFLDVTVRFIFITEHLSFLPAPIKKNCNLICIPRPPITKVKQWFKVRTTHNDCEKVNLKNNFALNKRPVSNTNRNTLDVNYFIELIKSPDKHELPMLREKLYEIITTNQEVSGFLKQLLFGMIEQDVIPNEKVNGILEDWFEMIKLYNNNYRPIYHLERMIVSIINTIHE